MQIWKSSMEIEKLIIYSISAFFPICGLIFLEKEILYVDHLRWNEKDDDHLKLFK